MDEQRSWPTGNTPEEPSGPMRQVARFMRDAFVAMLAEGFTERQALEIAGRMFAEVVRVQAQQKDDGT